MNCLLDTHVLLWLLAEPARLPDAVQDQLSDRRTHLFVSSASALEIAIKVRLGKLAAPTLAATLPGDVAELGAAELPITIDHAVLAGSMAWSHRDPFDRLLVAQARLEHLVLVTVDREIRRLPDLQTISW